MRSISCHTPVTVYIGLFCKNREGHSCWSVGRPGTSSAARSGGRVHVVAMRVKKIGIPNEKFWFYGLKEF